MILLDTDILIDVQRGYPPALNWFANLTTIPAVPGFVVMELVQDARDARKVLKLVAPLQIIWPTETDCARALTDFVAYHLSHRLGLLDALIAACAVGHSATLYTFNVKHYGTVPNLVTAQPYTR